MVLRASLVVEMSLVLRYETDRSVSRCQTSVNARPDDKDSTLGRRTTARHSSASALCKPGAKWRYKEDIQMDLVRILHGLHQLQVIAPALHLSQPPRGSHGFMTGTGTSITQFFPIPFNSSTSDSGGSLVTFVTSLSVQFCLL